MAQYRVILSFFRFSLSLSKYNYVYLINNIQIIEVGMDIRFKYTVLFLQSIVAQLF